MEIVKNITINQAVSAIWNVLVNDFDKVQDWLADVPKSYKMEEGEAAHNAPMIGRICELSSKPNPPLAIERITEVDEASKTFKVNIVPENGKIPVEENNLTVKLNELDENKTKVVWSADLTLKTTGKLLYPVLKASVGKSFAELLEELKHYTETGEPHPRKLAKLTNA